MAFPAGFLSLARAPSPCVACCLTVSWAVAPPAEGSSPAPSPHEGALLDEPLPVLIRATNGKGKRNRDKRIKLSTVVDPGTLDAFYLRYAELCKAGIVALKPRDRSKKKAKARKKKGGPAPTGVS